VTADDIKGSVLIRRTAGDRWSNLTVRAGGRLRR
jgi:hypothetical protein